MHYGYIKHISSKQVRKAVMIVVDLVTFQMNFWKLLLSFCSDVCILQILSADDNVLTAVTENNFNLLLDNI